MKADLDNLREILEGHSQLLIIPHNDPDPDAIATAVGLHYLVAMLFGLDARIGYQGLIGRAENKALVRYLNNPLHKLNDKEMTQDVPIALVDTQPGAGNNPLPDHITAAIVIDHHARREGAPQARFIDVRPDVGASATLMTEYLQTAGLDIPSSLATALFYGIKTDTMGLGRGASPEDAAAYFFLQPMVDVEALVQIERAQVPATYFSSLTAAIQAARLYGGDLLISSIGEMSYPDLGAEIADLLLRLQGVKWVVCIGKYEKELILSVRSRSRRIGAGAIARHVVGDLGAAGGHGAMAGGHIQLHQEAPEQLSAMLSIKALEFIKGEASLSGRPLI
jgi:nanoRNase/pAp phosphatase (c-di-AMP/oligoRNAs hydrolase)